MLENSLLKTGQEEEEMGVPRGAYSLGSGEREREKDGPHDNDDNDN